MNEAKIEQSAFLHYMKLSSLQEPIFEDFKSSLNEIINEKIRIYSEKMKDTRVSCYHELLQWESDTTKLIQQQMNEKQALIDNLQVEKENLQNKLDTCSIQIDSQRKQILAQQNELENKSKRIQDFERTQSEKDTFANTRIEQVDELKLRMKILKFAYYEIDKKKDELFMENLE